MKQFLLVGIIALCAIITGCEQKRNEFNIYPLSPFSDVKVFPKDEGGNNDMPKSIKTQYYIVSESTDYTDKTRIRLEDYIAIKLNSDVHNNKTIYFTFYKGGFSFNRNSVQSKDQLETDHANDKIAEFEYVDGKQYNFDFYKDGRYYTPPSENNESRDDTKDQ